MFHGRDRSDKLEGRGSVAQIAAMSAASKSLVPVIDLAPYFAGTAQGTRRVTAQLDRACREVGFYIIVGHGVEPHLIEEVETVSRAFFDLPLEEKMKVHIGNTPGGWSAQSIRASGHPRRINRPDT